MPQVQLPFLSCTYYRQRQMETWNCWPQLLDHVGTFGFLQGSCILQNSPLHVSWYVILEEASKYKWGFFAAVWRGSARHSTCKFHQIAQQQQKNLRDNMELNSWGASLQAHPGVYSFHLRISTGSSIYVVSTRICEWWGSKSCSFCTSIFGYVLTVCSAPQPGNGLYLVAATVSLTLSICSGASAESVQTSLSRLLSCPGPNLFCQLFITDCLRRGKMESPPPLVFTLCVCVHTHKKSWRVEFPKASKI